MVVFTCNHCGDTLQKPRVAKHYQFQCRRPKFLTCVDCHKDFRAEEYTTHTKCITEAERYGGKGYVPKPSANKGERKQQAWLNVVHNLLNSGIDLSPAERSFLNSISKHENIPRKKVKFFNFIKSVFGHRVNVSVAESVWAKMETAHQQAVADSDTKEEKSIEENQPAQHLSENGHQENNIAENENNENMCRENGNGHHQNETEVTEKPDNSEEGKESGKKKKKSKKRQISEPQDNEEQKVQDPSPKKRKTKAPESNGTENDMVQEVHSSIPEVTAFSWGDVMLEIVQAKGEISLKKLQKKVISRYLAQCTDSTEDKAISKFNKKLKKVSALVVSDEKVRIA